MLRISHFVNTIRVWLFHIIIFSDTIQIYLPSKNLHTQVKIALVSIWFRMVLTPTITQVHKASLSP